MKLSTKLFLAIFGVTAATLTFTFKRATHVNRISLQEYIPLGQRVKAFTVEYLNGRQWRPVEVGEETTTIGYKRLLRFPTITAKALRINITDSRGPLCLNAAGAYYAAGAEASYKADTRKYDQQKLLR